MSYRRTPLAKVSKSKVIVDIFEIKIKIRKYIQEKEGGNVLMMMSFKDAQNYKVLWSDFTMVSRFRKNIGKESH